MKDFFISYTNTDKDWAEWIACTLESLGHSVVYQGSDFLAGQNFVLRMQDATTEANQTIAVLSEDYLKSGFTAPEWAAAFASDPEGRNRKLLPIRVKECKPTGFLGTIIYTDLVGLSERDANVALQNAVRPLGRTRSRRFPGIVPNALLSSVHVAPASRPFPGISTPDFTKSASPQTGSIISRSCDRWQQQEDFEDAFKSSVQNCREYPQVYLIHGPAREGHRGLVERFRDTIIQEYADFISGTKTSLGVWEFDWSYKLDVENAKQQLMEWLIIRSHKDDPKYRFERQKHSAVTFREALAALPKVIVVQHTIEADKWTPKSGQLIRAYLEFWDEVKKNSDIPQFVIFLNVVYQAVLRVSVWKPWRKWNELQQRYNRKRIKAELNQICSLPGRQPLAIRDGVFCLCTLLEELSCVRISHLQKWFEKYHLGRNEVAWETQSKNIFCRRGWHFDDCINMVDIEDALDEFIEIMRTSSNDIVSMGGVR